MDMQASQAQSSLPPSTSDHQPEVEVASQPASYDILETNLAKVIS